MKLKSLAIIVGITVVICIASMYAVNHVKTLKNWVED